MKKLVFSSDLLKLTDRYSKDLALPDYLYDQNGNLDREATIQTLLSEEYGFVDADGIKLDVSVLKERQEDPYSGIYAGSCKIDFKLSN